MTVDPTVLEGFEGEYEDIEHDSRRVCNDVEDKDLGYDYENGDIILGDYYNVYLHQFMISPSNVKIYEERKEGGRANPDSDC